jgi:hypothetical protein
MSTLRSVPVANGPVSIVILLALLAIAVLMGAAVGTGAYIAVAPLALVLPAIYLLMRPDICLIFFAGLTLLVAGTLKYFLGLGQFQWALSALGAALLAYSLVRKLFSKNDRRVTADGIQQAMLLWWAGLIFASAANAVPPLDWLVGLRIYLPVFGIFAYLAYCRPSEILLKRIFLFMLAIASVQWIFCLYQKLQVVPIRIASNYPGSPWDSIVGTFGGEKFGGGESGSLGIYLSIIMVLAVALKKYGQLKSLALLVVFLTGFAAMALIESKVIAIMIPLGCFLVYRDYAFKQPVKFVLGTLVLGGLMLGLLVVYYYLYWQTDNNLGLIDALFARFSYSFDPYFQASTTNLGRVKSLLFWWDKHALLDDPLTLLIGHGLASAVSSSSIIGEGGAVHRYGIMLDVTGVSKLLWESGLIGLVVFLLIFAFGFFRARSLKIHPVLPAWHRAAMVGVEAVMVLMPLSIFYEVTIVSSPPMQFMAMFLLGYVAYWWRETEGARGV